MGDTPFAEIGSAVAIEVGEHIYIPINDLQGNIAGLYDPIKQSLLDENAYTAFGVENASSEINPWRYLSKHADEESGLIYFGRRYYDPSVGRWLTTDPKGYTDSMNLYAFALNDPFMLVDPYGLMSFPSMPISYIHPEITLGHVDNMSKIYEHPRTQGLLEALGGAGEFAAGAGMTIETGGLAGVAGVPMMTHGADRFYTGLRTLWSGVPQVSGTQQILQTVGLLSTTAANIDVGLSFASGAAAKGVSSLSSFNKRGFSDKSLANLSKVKVAKTLEDLSPTIERIQKNIKHPHRNDGAVFRNRERLLSKKNEGYYREYVHPTPGIKGPGPQRVVIGDQGEIFYTPDHYQTFIQIKPGG